ncbi:MAG: tRNA (adenosine(37)-N6)-dimethylallyltransferase MiaA [Deltaproteobacteria bacterium]|nr:tRNA (adenosine(37)-N6)-dimethylallyltransferase MiaA [Deltaproteobacteria bacterium]
MPAAIDVDRSQIALLVLVGPTATGKTSIAVELCEWLQGEIIGADSIQVYRGFDIGSSKPRAENLRGIRHHLIDIIYPDQAIDASAYAAAADRAIDEVVSRGKVPVVAGGTGLWVRTLLRGLVNVPPVDEPLRAELERAWDEQGKEAMYNRLREVDPRSAARIHVNDRVRVIRALEVYEQTGFAMGELRAKHARGKPRYRALTIFIDIHPVHLLKRLETRARQMLEAGWIEEVRGLLDRYGTDIRPLKSVGYREVVEHIVESIPIEITEREIVRSTRRYARRQRTWFNSDPDIDERMTPEQVVSEVGRNRIRAHFSHQPLVVPRGTIR